MSDDQGRNTGTIAAFINRQPTVLLVVIAILSLSISFFTFGIIRVILGLVCMVCAFAIMQRAIAKSIKDRCGDSDKT
jgi:hypothetical protein